ncbi:hypothetical protein ASZ90_003148 [hydrocarbon metagenome]|uniref:Uncharacterized protein n=1 Tax=hydrocarbon metagenome TaxID=938273 RepID=A0A0W8G1H7_9ZZZZ
MLFVFVGFRVYCITFYRTIAVGFPIGMALPNRRRMKNTKTLGL